MKRIYLLLLISMFGLAACGDGTAEDLGERIDDAATDVGNAIEDLCEDARRAVAANDPNC